MAGWETQRHPFCHSLFHFKPRQKKEETLHKIKCLFVLHSGQANPTKHINLSICALNCRHPLPRFKTNFRNNIRNNSKDARTLIWLELSIVFLLAFFRAWHSLHLAGATLSVLNLCLCVWFLPKAVDKLNDLKTFR